MWHQGVNMSLRPGGTPDDDMCIRTPGELAFWPDVLALSACEVAGAFIGAMLVWVVYLPHFKTIPEPPSEDPREDLLCTTGEGCWVFDWAPGPCPNTIGYRCMIWPYSCMITQIVGGQLPSSARRLWSVHNLPSLRHIATCRYSTPRPPLTKAGEKNGGKRTPRTAPSTASKACLTT